MGPSSLTDIQRDQLPVIEAFYADSKNRKRERKKKPIYKNKNSMSLISCQHNQKFPFLLFPLKSPRVLIMLAQSGKTLVGF